MSETTKGNENEVWKLGTKSILATEKRNGRSVSYNGEVTEVLSKYFCYVF